MKTRLLNLIDNFRESFWFAPAMFAVGAILLALGLLKLDSTLSVDGQSETWFVRDAQAAQQILTAVASSVMTLAGVVFSITLVALSIASSQFGSRLLRCYMMESKADQLAGLLLSTGLFCYVVLHQVNDGEGEAMAFVPQYAVAAAALLGFTSVAMLIWFVHSTALNIQAPRLIATVSRDLDAAVDRLIPESPEDAENQTARTTAISAAECDPDQELPQDPVMTVNSPYDGYIEGIDEQELVALAKRENLFIKLQQHPGNFTTKLTELAEVFSLGSSSIDEETKEEIEAEVHSNVVIGLRRTPRQDITCSMIELVEVATRALSPGVNNPFLALNCVDRLSATMARVARREIPGSKVCDEDGTLRLLACRPTFDDLMTDAFAQIRQHGSSSVSVAIRLIEALQRIARETRDSHRLAVIRREAEGIQASFLRSDPPDIDISDFDRRFEQLVKQWQLTDQRCV
ncbi:MAG: DUF2254 domain-containing protein [Fuerstiella sp.]